MLQQQINTNNDPKRLPIDNPVQPLDIENISLGTPVTSQQVIQGKMGNMGGNSPNYTKNQHLFLLQQQREAQERDQLEAEQRHQREYQLQLQKEKREREEREFLEHEARMLEQRIQDEQRIQEFQDEQRIQEEREQQRQREL